MQIRLLRPEDAEQVFRLRIAAFSSLGQLPFDPDEVYIPDEHRLVAVDGDRVIGHAGVWPLHQAFGGRAVPMGGVRAVVVADDRRGRGVGSALLGAALEHMRCADMPISTLYPATAGVYRRAGWDYGGSYLVRRIATRDLLAVPPPPDDVDVRPYEEADLPALVAVHDARASAEPGGLVVGMHWLRRALQPDPDDARLAITAVRDGAPAGLLLGERVPAADGHSSFDLRIDQLIGSDRGVERALWRVVALHHSVGPMTAFVSAPAEPLLHELSHGVAMPGPSSVHAMTRLVDAPGAIAARGWPALTASVPVRVVDAHVAENDGAFVLELTGRTASLTPGGSGRVTVGVGALSSLYTGFRSASQLAHAGLLTGATSDDLAVLDDAFAGPSPVLRHYF